MVKNVKTIILITFGGLISIAILIIISNLLIKASDKDIIFTDTFAPVVVKCEEFDINSLFSQTNEVLSVATKYSALYKNDINRKMIVFSTQVRENKDENFLLFDNKLYENDDGSYRTNNIEFNMLFTQNKIEMQRNSYSSPRFNIILDGKKELKKEIGCNTIYGKMNEFINYSQILDNVDANIILGYNGMLMELNFNEIYNKNEIDMELDIEGFKYLNDAAGYVQILKNDYKIGIIYQGIITDGETYFLSKVKIKDKNGKKYINIDLSGLPFVIDSSVTLNLHFDFYSDKMFFDTSVYKSSANTNCLLNNVTIFDTLNEKNEGYTYYKYNIKSFTPKDSTKLDSLFFNFYVMAVTDSVDIEIYKVNRDWCSWTINWNDKPSYGAKIGEFTISETGWHEIELTEYAKHLIDNNYDKLENNSIMFKIKDGSKGYVMAASADNAYKPPYFVVNYRVS